MVDIVVKSDRSVINLLLILSPPRLWVTTSAVTVS